MGAKFDWGWFNIMPITSYKHFRVFVFIFLALFLVHGGIFSQNILEERWVQLNQAVVHGNSMAYDQVSDTLLIPQVNEDGPVYIFSAEDGSLTTRTLEKAREVFGDLGCFAMGAESRGKIYGHVHDPDRRFVIWDGIEDDFPTTRPLPGNRLARNMEIFTSGSETTIYLTGSSDSGPIEVYGAKEGEDFSLREIFGGVGAESPGPGGKAGVTACGPYPADLVFCS